MPKTCPYKAAWAFAIATAEDAEDRRSICRCDGGELGARAMARPYLLIRCLEGAGAGKRNSPTDISVGRGALVLCY